MSSVHEDEFKNIFKHFVLEFIKPSDTNNDTEPDNITNIGDITNSPYYIQLLRHTFESFGSQVLLPNTNENPSGIKHPNLGLQNFLIDLQHIRSYSESVFECITKYPSDCIVYMDEVLLDILKEEYPNVSSSKMSLKVGLYNSPHVISMRDLDPQHLETLITFRGIIIRVSSIIPEMTKAVFRCTARNVPGEIPGTFCHHEEEVPLINGEVQEPLQCARCQYKYSFELYHARCSFMDKQLIKVQEYPGSIPEGETPQTGLIDAVKPGDYTEITGIYRASGVRVLPRLRVLKSVYRTYIDANYIGKDHLSRLTVSPKELSGLSADAEYAYNEFSTNDQEPVKDTLTEFISTEITDKMKEISQDPYIYEKLVQSLAPNIWECDDVKKGLLCQLFGGTTKNIGGHASRSDIHILLCGDPSTAKSQLLQYVHGIAPRGIYTCGRGSSAVGLTASVTKDPETKEFVLESGAIVLSDRGICCIDEFDKMDERARTILHEVMEQQTVSIAKAGIVCSLNARTAILASANPINSRYDTKKSVVENIHLPPTLMSRFDFIYLMVDTASPALDRALARHLCELYTDAGHSSRSTPPFTRETFSNYISYARKTCKPKLTAESGNFLIQTYIEIRRKGSDAMGRSLNATPRQLESLIRISESLAKMELSNEVQIKHVKEAVRLMEVATYAALIDPTTGRLDFEQLNSGVSGAHRARNSTLEKLIIACLENCPNGLDKSEIIDYMNEKLASANEYLLDPNGRELQNLIKDLESVGTLARVYGGKIIYNAGG